MDKQISVIIPVYQESDTINQTLRQFSNRALNEAIEIIVVDGDEHGSTLGAIDNPKVKKVLAPKGRAIQMNRGAALATGEIFVFLHADTFLPLNAMAQIQRATKNKQVVGGAFELGIDSEKTRFRIIEAAVKIRTRLTRIPYGDQAIFITSTFFHRMGGFPEIPIMEDVALMQSIKKEKAKIALLPSKVRTSPRRWEKEGVVHCTLRNSMLALLYFGGMSPSRLARYYP